MARQIAGFDWSATPLGAIDTWPQSLRTVVDMMLASGEPAYIAWGREHSSLFNDAYIPILGDKFPGALGLPFARLWSEIRDEFEPIVAAIMAGRSQSFVDRPVALAGRAGMPVSWFTFSCTPLRDESGTVRGFYCAAFETTQKVREETARLAEKQQALAASEERYRQLFEAIDEGFCVIEVLFDPEDRPVDYRFVDVNPAFERQTGLADATGRTARELAPGLEGHWFETYGRVALTGEPVRFQNNARGLGDRWFDVFAFRVGRPTDRRVAILFNDISARKRAEDGLLAADRRKDEFLATLAHELRNPMAPLRNGLHIARLQSRDSPALHATLDMMDRQLSHLVHLVDDLLDVGRISSGKLDLKRAPVDLGRALHTSIESTRSAFHSQRHELSIEMAPGPVWVMGDEARLAQVFTNILTNAAKFTAPGGRVNIVLAREGDQAVVGISDNGLGIPLEHQDGVFDLFSQVREHQGLIGGGLGIGLAIVRQLVALHGGVVELASAGSGTGSTFTVRLPALAAAPDRERPAERGAPPSVARQRVMVVDDNTDAADSLAELLRMLGHEVWIANDGASALSLVQSVRPHIVFLDLGMPVMDGIEVARRIRGMPEHEAVRLVALTGWGQERDRARTAEAGFNLHLVKPANPDDIEQLLERAA